MRKDLYNALLEYQSKGEKLEPEEQRALDKFLLDYKRNGMALSQENLARVTSLKKEINDLCLQYNKNVNENNTVVKFTREELEGLPADWLDNIKKETGEDGIEYYLVSLQYPDLFPVLERAINRETRKKMSMIADKKCETENIPILKTVLAKRQELSELLGYDSDASYVLEIKMAKHIKTVIQFLESISIKLDKIFYPQLKKTTCSQNGRRKSGNSISPIK